MYKYRVKRPDGSFTGLFNAPSEAVLEASSYVTIPWREGCEAVAKLDNNLTSICVFKDPITGQMCGVDRVKIDGRKAYQLTVEFQSEADRDAAENILYKTHHKSATVRDEYRISEPFSVTARKEIEI